jgi:hypothetical protein
VLRSAPGGDSQPGSALAGFIVPRSSAAVPLTTRILTVARLTIAAAFLGCAWILLASSPAGAAELGDGLLGDVEQVQDARVLPQDATNVPSDGVPSDGAVAQAVPSDAVQRTTTAAPRPSDAVAPAPQAVPAEPVIAAAEPVELAVAPAEPQLTAVEPSIAPVGKVAGRTTDAVAKTVDALPAIEGALVDPLVAETQDLLGGVAEAVSSIDAIDVAGTLPLAAYTGAGVLEPDLSGFRDVTPEARSAVNVVRAESSALAGPGLSEVEPHAPRPDALTAALDRSHGPAEPSHQAHGFLPLGAPLRGSAEAFSGTAADLPGGYSEPFDSALRGPAGHTAFPATSIYAEPGFSPD